MAIIEQVQELLVAILQLPDGSRLSEDAPLLGAIPEFDSMAVVSVITAMEERFGFAIDDDDINAEVFETLGSLAAFVERKLG